MADTTSSDPIVDETPISPIDRQNSLEKHLQMRPDAKDLKDRHILLDTKAAPYDSYSAQGEMEEQILNSEKRATSRPSRA